MIDVRCPDHLAAVRAFASSIGKADQLQKQLDFLAHYGHSGMPEAELPPEDAQDVCVLAKDFAPHSFSFALYRRDPEAPSGLKFMFNGGLIFQSVDIPANGGAPSFTVSLAEGTGWFVHT